MNREYFLSIGKSRPEASLIIPILARDVKGSEVAFFVLFQYI
jgi:hypothetical protein